MFNNANNGPLGHTVQPPSSGAHTMSPGNPFYFVKDLSWLEQSMEVSRVSYLRRILRYNKKNPQKKRPVERDWLNSEKFLAEWLPRAAFTWGMTLGPEHKDQRRHTFLKRIRPDKGFIRGNLIMTGPDARSTVMGPGYHYKDPHITDGSLQNKFLQLTVENKVPKIISKVVTQEQWDYVWEVAKKPSDPIFPSWDEVFPNQSSEESNRAYHKAVTEAKVIGKDKFFSPTLAKKILDEEPDLTPEELVDKVYDEVAKRVVQLNLEDGKVEKKYWDTVIKQLSASHDVEIDVVTEIMVRHDGKMGTVLRNLGLYKTRAVPIYLWKRGKRITRFDSIQEVTEVTGLSYPVIIRLRNTGATHKETGHQFTAEDEQPFAGNVSLATAQAGVKLWDSMKPMLRNVSASPIAQKAILSQLKGYSLVEISEIVDVSESMLEVIIDTALNSINTISDAALRKKK